MIGIEHMGVTEEQLNGLGNRWAKKDGEVRWYVNDWQDAIGMEVVYYKTGNVSDVYYHGGNGWHGDGHPSNSWYYKNVAGTKVWIDVQGRVHVDYCKDAGVERDIVAKVGERVQAAIDAQAPAAVVVEVCAKAEAQAPVEEEEELEGGWSEELADERAEAPRMAVRNAAGETATIRRVLEQEDLERYGAEELSEAPKDAMWGVQWDQSAVFGWLREGLEQAAEIMQICLRREDGEVARVEAYALESDIDLWQPLERTFPQAYGLIDEGAVLPSDGRYDWSESFGPREGGALAMWLREGMANAADFGYDYDLDADLRWNLDRTEAELKVFGTVGGRDAEIVFRAAASEWDELRGLFGRGDEDALAAWHLAHLESVGWSE